MQDCGPILGVDTNAVVHQRGVPLIVVWLLTIGLLASFACSSEQSVEPMSSGECAPGSVVACVCENGTPGMATCDTGGQFEPCGMCSAVGPDAGVPVSTKDGSVTTPDTPSDAALSEPDQMPVPVDAEIVPNPVDIQCDDRSGRAVLSGTFRCDAQPLYVDIDGDNGRYQIFAYEASHPLALPDNSHPCGTVEGANGQRVNFQAPDEPTEACSKPGVRPWHSVSWEDAKRACEFIGWRLCTRDEFLRACGGPDSRAFPYGSVFREGACNVRDSFRNVDSQLSSEAPTGHFQECISTEQAYDMTGNLWEWVDEREEGAPGVRYFMGMGYRTVAERHQDFEMRCEADTRLNGGIAGRYINETVGFRCCRSVD